MEILYNDPTDPWNQTQFAYQDGQLTINNVQDVEPTLKLMEQLRNAEYRFDKPRNWNLFASIPNVEIMRLKEEGIDIFRLNKDSAMRKKFLRKIQYEYPYLKATNKRHL